jgi:hypothetical protein
LPPGPIAPRQTSVPPLPLRRSNRVRERRASGPHGPSRRAGRPAPTRLTLRSVPFPPGRRRREHASARRRWRGPRSVSELPPGRHHRAPARPHRRRVRPGT